MNDFKITGGPGDDPSGWTRHLLLESKRLGEYVREEGQATQKRFDELRDDFHVCQKELREDMSKLNLDLTKKIAKLEQQQAVTVMEMRLKIVGLSVLVSSIISVMWGLVQSGLLG